LPDVNIVRLRLPKISTPFKIISRLIKAMYFTHRPVNCESESEAFRLSHLFCQLISNIAGVMLEIALKKIFTRAGA
jgi:hypothetical protein